MKRVIVFLLLSANLWAELPEGPGRTETERLCQNCHDLARAVSRRQDRDGWQTTLNKMVAFGTKGTDQEFALILDYLAKNFPAEELPPVNVNKPPPSNWRAGFRSVALRPLPSLPIAPKTASSSQSRSSSRYRVWMLRKSRPKGIASSFDRDGFLIDASLFREDGEPARLSPRAIQTAQAHGHRPLFLGCKSPAHPQAIAFNHSGAR
jgi:hypothetical protein